MLGLLTLMSCIRRGAIGVFRKDTNERIEPKAAFGRLLHAAVANSTVSQPRVEGKPRLRIYVGIGLKDGLARVGTRATALYSVKGKLDDEQKQQ